MKICVLALEILQEMVNNGYAQILIQKPFTDCLVSIIEQTDESDLFLLTPSL